MKEQLWMIFSLHSGRSSTPDEDQHLLLFHGLWGTSRSFGKVRLALSQGVVLSGAGNQRDTIPHDFAVDAGGSIRRLWDLYGFIWTYMDLYIYMDLYGFIYHSLPGSMAFKHQMSYFSCYIKVGMWPPGLRGPIFHQLQVWQRVGETQAGPCAAEVSHCQPAPMLFLLLVRFLLGIQPGLIGLVQQIRYNQLQHYQQLTLPRSP